MNMHFRSHFPFFYNNPDWIYLDSSATTLKPKILLDTTSAFYCSAGSVHRSQYDHSQTEAFERARTRIAERFHLNAEYQVVWTSGTTHAINLVAQGLEGKLQAGDEIVISIAEHHANFIPWQQLAERRQAKLVVLPLNADYLIDEDRLKEHLSARTKIVAFNLVSNVTGIRQPAERLISLIRQDSNALILLDIAQAVCTEQVDCVKLDADFYAFSAHKLYGPTGVGVLIGKNEALAQLRPLFFGGKMLKTVTEQHLSLAELPYRLEAGTPNIAGIIGFGAVLEWLENWDLNALNMELYQLGELLYKRLKLVKNLHIFGDNPHRSTFSFTIEGIHHADLSALLSEQQIAIRVGEHCAQPYLRYLQQQGTLRVSLAHYNSVEDVERFIEALHIALRILEGE